MAHAGLPRALRRRWGVVVQDGMAPWPLKVKSPKIMGVPGVSGGTDGVVATRQWGKDHQTCTRHGSCTRSSSDLPTQTAKCLGCLPCGPLHTQGQRETRTACHARPLCTQNCNRNLSRSWASVGSALSDVDSEPSPTIKHTALHCTGGQQHATALSSRRVKAARTVEQLTHPRHKPLDAMGPQLVGGFNAVGHPSHQAGTHSS